jgi:hypothetical protein
MLHRIAAWRRARARVVAHLARVAIGIAWASACAAPTAPPAPSPAPAARVPPPATFEPTAASRCNVGYPEDFPCLEGSQLYTADIIVPVTPGARLASALIYPLSADTLSTRLNEAATAAGWRIDSTASAIEGGDPRIRTRLSRGDRRIATSIVPYEGGSLLQIVVYGER